MAATTRYSTRQQNEKYAVAVGAYLAKLGVVCKIRHDEERDLWFLDHDKRISQQRQMLVTGFIEGLESAYFFTE